MNNPSESIRQLRQAESQDIDPDEQKRLFSLAVDEITALIARAEFAERKQSYWWERVKADSERTAKFVTAKLPIILRDLLGFVSAASTAYGAGLIYRPAGFIVAGVLGMAIVYVAVLGD